MSDPNFTYVGPLVSPTLVVGVFNDAWNRANERSSTAADRIAELSPGEVDPLGALVAPIGHDLDLTGAIPPLLADGELDPVREAVITQLKDMLRDLIDKYYPPVAVVNGAEVWERIARAFTSGHLFQHLDLIQARAGRGLFTPRMQSGMNKYLAGQRNKAAELMQLSVEVLVTSRKTDFELLYYEQLMQLQVDALQSCRAFLLDALTPLRTRLTTDLTQLARFKLQLQASYFKYIDARVIEGSTELDRLFTERKIAITRELSEADRRAFIFDLLAKAAADEALNVSQQASAAINAVNASASFQGSEQA